MMKDLGQLLAYIAARRQATNLDPLHRVKQKLARQGRQYRRRERRIWLSKYQPGILAHKVFRARQRLKELRRERRRL